jgi:hypothetical protein
MNCPAFNETAMKKMTAVAIAFLLQQCVMAQSDSLNNHKVLLDKDAKIISWIQPQQNAYSEFLHQRWNFIKKNSFNSPAPLSQYPQYYFYCAYIIKNGELQPDNWMNDIGERIPNWFESARLYYAYTGDMEPMNIVIKLIDYALEHGTSPPDFAWPNFPYTTANAGDSLFRGFTTAGRFVLHEIQVDHAGEIGLTYFRLYQFTGNEKYKAAAIKVANTLAAKARIGTATHSVWPYRVVLNTGEAKAEYGANWIGCYTLFDNLVKTNTGNTSAYKSAMKKVKDFLLQFPMKTGYWTDGHSDTDVNSPTYKSNLSASNMKLYLLDHPEFDSEWKMNLPKLIKWTEDNFVTRTVGGEPSNQWGANIVGEQDSFLYKMDYQTARYAAECARWFVVSGDEQYKEKAYRSLNWVTYCNTEAGMATESPVSKGINSWWSDCYGEGPRMFYHVFAAMPEWAPANENHILYSEGILKNIVYADNSITYNATANNGTEFIKTKFKPVDIRLNGKKLNSTIPASQQGYIVKSIGNGDYAITIKRTQPGEVVITGTN